VDALGGSAAAICVLPDGAERATGAASEADDLGCSPAAPCVTKGDAISGARCCAGAAWATSVVPPQLELSAAGGGELSSIDAVVARGGFFALCSRARAS